MERVFGHWTMILKWVALSMRHFFWSEMEFISNIKLNILDEALKSIVFGFLILNENKNEILTFF